jgi:D-3-phosphoglycerate dehydrogenase
VIDLRVLVTGAALAPAAESVLTSAGCDVVFMRAGIAEADLAAALKHAPTPAILMRGNPPIGAALMDLSPGLKVISKHGAGVDSVDLAAATARGIRVMIAGDANAPAVAEHAIALMLTLGRDIPRFTSRTRDGHWDRAGYEGREVAGRVLGIIGFGRIGRLVAAKAACLGMDVLVLPRRPGTVDIAVAKEASDLSDLLARSDIVSLHLPLTATTKGMIDAAALAAMRPGALLVNTARGALVDEAALLQALGSGRLGGAALDGLSVEPAVAGHPLLQLQNVIVTPHIASATGTSLVRMGVVAARNIVAVLTGQPVDPGNIVGPEAKPAG